MTGLEIVLIPVLLFFLIAPFAVYYNYRFQLRNREEMKVVALRLGMKYSDPSIEAELRAPAARSSFMETLNRVDLVFEPWKITGIKNGVRVQIRLVRHGPGKSKKTWTQFRAWYENPAGCELHILNDSSIIQLSNKLFGLQDILTNDAEFDNRFVVKANDEAKAKTFLTPAFRKAVITLSELLPDAEVTDEGIGFEILGILKDEAKYEAILEAMTNAASQSVNVF